MSHDICTFVFLSHQPPVKNAVQPKKDIKGTAAPVAAPAPAPAASTTQIKAVETKADHVVKAEKSESVDDLSVETPPAQRLEAMGMSVDEPLDADEPMTPDDPPHEVSTENAGL